MEDEQQVIDLWVACEMKHAENTLKHLGCPKIDLMVRDANEGVISFYRKIGYKEDPVVVLSKRLIEDEPYAFNV